MQVVASVRQFPLRAARGGCAHRVSRALRLIASLTVVGCCGVRLLEDGVACGVRHAEITSHMLAIFSPLADPNRTASHCRALFLSNLLICFFVNNDYAILGLLALVCAPTEGTIHRTTAHKLIASEAALGEW